MNALHLAIVTPLGKLFDGPITQVVAPGVQGGFAVLKGHAPLLAQLAPGVVRVHSHTSDSRFVVEGGVLEVRNNEVVIIARWAHSLAGGEDPNALLKERRDALEAAAEAAAKKKKKA